jgi:hypothetical protein
VNGETGLLEQAIGYAARSVFDVTSALRPRPTPPPAGGSHVSP